jgi:hypothetical protein
MFCLFYSPGDLESTGETTGDTVCKRNRNVVTNDQLHNPRCKGGLVEMIVILYVLLFIHPVTWSQRVKKRVAWFPNRAFLLNRESEFAAPEKKSDAVY